MKERSDAGSTLIELLISITLVGVILVIIMGAFRIGIRAWEAGERDVETFQRQQIVLSTLKRQLASVCWRPIPVEGDKSFVFKGETDLIDFVSTVAIVPGKNLGSVRVTYRVVRGGEHGRYSLEMAERNFLTGGMDQPIEMLDENMIYELIADVYDIHFEYLPAEGDGQASQWQPDWVETENAGLPAAVKCVLQMDENKPPVAVVARVISGRTSPEIRTGRSEVRR